MTDRSHGEQKYLPEGDRSGRAICLSGGGFRAALFHLGALRRLNEFGVLSTIDTFTSVSGGSIAAGLLASNWKRLQTDDHGVMTGFEGLVAQPLRAFCAEDLRTDVFLSRLAPGNWRRLAGRENSITNLLVERYAEVGMEPTLAELPDAPNFVFCAANTESGKSWTFGRRSATGEPEMGDYLSGYTDASGIDVATAVAASSAHPYIFPPLVLHGLDPDSFRDGRVAPQTRESVTLGDGGIYDNMGLEPVWKTHRTVLVSDAGAPFRFEDDPRINIFERLGRSYSIVESQALGMRKRWLINSFLAGVMSGTYWGIGSDHEHYDLDDSVGYAGTALLRLGDVRTDLDAFSEAEIAALENHGYSLADTAVRRWVPDLVPVDVPSFEWPHPAYSDDDLVEQSLEQSDRRGILQDLKDWTRRRVEDFHHAQ